MKISLCVTVLNEEGSISALLESLINQSKKPDEIVVVDGGSTDKTYEIIRHFQKKYSFIKATSQKCTRAEGRNLSVEIASGEIIATTDGGCVAEKDWLKNITKPFLTGRVDIAAGFYKMVGDSSLQKAESVFLGVTPRKFNHNFLPSTRSMAFSKKAFEEIGGFPEAKGNSAEDTDFNYKAVKLGLKYSRVKNALVEWGMPKTIKAFQSTIYNYAKWDIKYGIWWHPAQRFMSHNIKASLILLRYIFAVMLLIFSVKYTPLFSVLIILFFLYLIWSFRKIYSEFGEWKIAIWGPVLQIISDLAVMRGFISGIIG